MDAHTGMEVPADMVKLSVQVLNGSWCNETLKSYNATTVRHDETSTSLLTFTVVLMLLLGFFLLCFSVLRLVFGQQTLILRLGGYNLHYMVRMVLRVTFILFLPLLSSVFSRTKGGDDKESQSSGESRTELLLMLMWLLLVELIRRKVQVMDLPTDGSSFTRSIGRFTLKDYADELGHLIWTGYLVYNSILSEEATMKAIFIALWSISLAKLLQRVINTRKASHSWRTARNPLLIAGYMQHVITEKERERHSSSDATDHTDSTESTDPADATMEKCKFVVAKEHKLVGTKEEGTLCCIGEPRVVGLHLDLTKTNQLLTVSKVWKQKKGSNPLFQGRMGTYLENLCLSFSLFKMLRRRFEQYPMVEVGSMGRKMMIEGLLNLKDDGGPAVIPGSQVQRGTGSQDHRRQQDPHRPFQVLQLELEFLDNYYQAADPVVMSNPQLFFINFALSMLLVPIYLAAILMTLITNSSAACLYSAARSWSDNQISKFTFLYLAITLALLATVICIEATEFFTSYLLANWNTVRLACYYISGQRQLLRYVSYHFVKFRFFIYHVSRSIAKHVLRCGEDNIKINQVSIVNSCWPIRLTYKCTCQATLGEKAKEYIIDSLKHINMETGHISLQLPPFFPAAVTIPGDKRTETRTKSATEIILLCHLATELYDAQNQVEERAVAITLSRYCMYLVEHMPALLPDDETWISERASEMRSYLTRMAQQCYSNSMICMPISHCCKEEKNLEDQSTLEKLVKEIKNWEELAHFWVNLLIYLAPSDNIRGHAQAVASSQGELISCLWAFCTHAGITRLPLDASDPV